MQDRDFVALKICLKILDGSEDDEDSTSNSNTETMSIQISFRYSLHEVRPTAGSLRVTVKEATEPLSAEDEEELNNSCKVFYEKTLVKAVQEAF